jgi:hypothetical protein
MTSPDRPELDSSSPASSLASDRWNVVIVPTALAEPVEAVPPDRNRLRAQLVNTGANAVVINASREALSGPKPGFVLTPGSSIAIDTRAAIWAMSAPSPAGGGPSELSLIVETREPTA